jgi:Arc/MetJ family transcription regulator
MRTTIRLDDQLLAQAKRVAHDTGRTLSAVIEDALRAALAQRQTAPHRAEGRLPTFKGDGLLPGVDLDDSGSLLELMERGRGRL